MDTATKALFSWLDTFSIPIQHETPAQLSDGTAIAYVLHQIDAEYFHEAWLNKLKTDCGDNWRLKVSNVKKVIQRLIDYYNEVLYISVNIKETELANNIGEHEGRGVNKLLQLVLGCAVNCANKEKYIQIIMQMEEEVQHVVMTTIQEIMATTHSIPTAETAATGRDDAVAKLEAQLENEMFFREKLEQRLHDLDEELQQERHEKGILKDELQDLRIKLSKDEEPPMSMGAKVKAQRDQQSKLESELFKMEMQKEEMRSKYEEAERIVRELRAKNDELHKDREHLSLLKDELDVLRHTNEQVGRYEASLEMYRKKMEEMGDLKKQLKVLEEKNAEYLQINMKLEEEADRVSALKTQIEMYKKETHSLHERLTEEIQRADRSEFEYKRMADKMNTLQAERDRIVQEREELKEKIEELKFPQTNRQMPLEATASNMIRSGSEVLEDSPAILKDKLNRLKLENEALKKRQSSSADVEAFKELHSDTKKLLEETEQKLRQANMRILELESQAADNSVVRDLTEKLAKSKKEHEETLQKLKQSEETVNICVSKAKRVLKDLNDGSAEAALRHELCEKNEIISKLERDVAQMRTQYDSQEKLILTALHNYGAHEQRKAADLRLSQSFLSKQRQPTARKHNLTGVQSSEYFN